MKPITAADVSAVTCCSWSRPTAYTLTVQRSGTCEPISGATVEVWHCDALGVYSGYDSGPIQAQGEPPAGGPPAKPGGGPPPAARQAAAGTSSRPTRRPSCAAARPPTPAGRVTFQTIYPGWYMGRTVHIHVKVHVSGNLVHTGQLYFDDQLSDQVFAQDPSSAHGGRDTTNARDGIYQQGGRESTLSIAPTANGYLGRLPLVVQR